MIDYKPWALALLIAGAAATPLTALAQDDSQDTTEEDTGAQEDPVVAVVEGEEIRRSDVMKSAAELPPQYQQQIELIFPALVERLVDFKLLDKAAAERDLEEDEEVQARLEAIKTDIMRDVLLSKIIEEEVSDAEVEAAYEQHLEDNPAQEEIRARHILVETEEEAKEIIAQLDEGADFAELAKEKSTGPTGKNGGDLGYFTTDQMVAPFSEAAVALEPGSYTEAFTESLLKAAESRPEVVAITAAMPDSALTSAARTAACAFSCAAVTISAACSMSREDVWAWSRSVSARLRLADCSFVFSTSTSLSSSAHRAAASSS